MKKILIGSEQLLVKVSAVYAPNSPLPQLQYDADGKLKLPIQPKRKPMGYGLFEIDRKHQKCYLKNSLSVIDGKIERVPHNDQEFYSTEQEALEVLKNE